MSITDARCGSSSRSRFAEPLLPLITMKFRRLPLWLSLLAATMAAAMAALLVFELHQSQSIQEGEKLRVNAITSHSVLLDREYLRFRHALSNHLYDRRNPDIEVLELRINVLSTRVDILRQSPASAFFFVDAKNQQTLTKLENLLSRLYEALQAEEIDKVVLVRLLQEADELNPDVLSLGNSAEAMTASLLEKQGADILGLNTQITWLTLGLLVLFVVAAIALYRRDLAQAKEHKEVKALVTIAQQASRGKSQFLANMSHELRTPFNSILGMLQLLQTTGLNEVQADYVRTASGSASHLLTILNDILDMSSLEAGKMNMQPEPTQLQNLLRNVNDVMQPLALNKNLSYEFQADEGLPAWILADATRVKQVLFNLLNNAIKFTQQGGVVLQVTQETQASGQSVLLFSVQDTGVGMRPDTLSQLFKRFYQVDAGTARLHEGTGLGLEISQSLAQLMGGRIAVQSEWQKGSCFTFFLPVQPCEPPHAALTGHANSANLTTPSITGKRILVAEDNPVNQKLLGILLERMGHQATFCDNGQLAFDALVRQSQQEPFHLILMDIHMPVMDGLTCTRAVRNLPWPIGDTPIVVISADVMNDARETALAAGVNDFISKPLQMARLEEIMQKYLHLHE